MNDVPQQGCTRPALREAAVAAGASSLATRPRLHAHGGRGRRPQGFVLVAVLAALVVITLLAAAVALVSERAMAEAQANVAAFEGEVAMTGTRDTMLYLLNTQRQTFGGITVDDQMVWSVGQATALREDVEERGGQSPLPIGNEIRLDGTPYVGVGETRFALQDDAGLFSPNWASPIFRERFFQQRGIAPPEVPGIEATRLDYQDPDMLYRLGGAEAAAYRSKGLPSPSNRPLVTPLEARRIMQWDKVLAGLDDAAVMSLLTVSRISIPNVNSAPLQVLRTIPGVDEDMAARMVALRDQTPFLLVWQLVQTFGLPLSDDDTLLLFAANSGTLRLWHNATGPVRVIHWTLTPYDEGGRPWRLDYEIALPRDEVTDNALARTTQTPLFAPPAAAGR